MPASKAQRARTAQRRTKAIALRMAGADYQTIADKLGYSSRAAAYVDIDRALQVAVTQQRQAAEVYVEQEVARLDRLQLALWPAALGGDVEAAKACLQFIRERCKLRGSYAPQRHEVITMSAIDAEIERLSLRLGEGADADAAG